jgi:hypothetical protein
VAEQEIPLEVQKFIAAYISSVEQLEILQLVSGTPDKWWTAEEVYAVVQSNRASVAERLDGLAAQGLAVADRTNAPVRFRYSPGSEELGRCVQGATLAYRQQRIRVIELIFSKPHDALRHFADAFKLRKQDKDNG